MSIECTILYTDDGLALIHTAVELDAHDVRTTASLLCISAIEFTNKLLTMLRAIQYNIV